LYFWRATIKLDRRLSGEGHHMTIQDPATDNAPDPATPTTAPGADKTATSAGSPDPKPKKTGFLARFSSGLSNGSLPLRAVFILNLLFMGGLEFYFAPWSDQKALPNFMLLNFALGGAAGFSGGLLGFIFGVPRAPETAPPGQTLGVNSNLVQISDWLTKLLVGASLASLGNLPSFALKLVRYLDAGVYKGLPGGGTFALFILCFFFVLGFFWTYIETRTYLTTLLGSDAHPSAKV
jgi:hypothetical protein